MPWEILWHDAYINMSAPAPLPRDCGRCIKGRCLLPALVCPSFDAKSASLISSLDLPEANEGGERERERESGESCKQPCHPSSDRAMRDRRAATATATAPFLLAFRSLSLSLSLSLYSNRCAAIEALQTTDKPTFCIFIRAVQQLEIVGQGRKLSQKKKKTFAFFQKGHSNNLYVEKRWRKMCR